MGPYPIHDAAWQQFCSELGKRLKWPVERRNKSVAVSVDDVELEIVPFNGPFDENSVPFENLFGTPNDNTISRAGADAMLQEFFQYSSTRNAARVAKAVFCKTGLAETVPWGYLLSLLLYRHAKEGGPASMQEKLRSDWAGVDLFQALLKDLTSLPIQAEKQGTKLAQRWARNRGWGPQVDEAYEAWSATARKIHALWEEKGLVKANSKDQPKLITSADARLQELSQQRQAEISGRTP